MSSGLYSGQPGLSLGTGLYRTVSGLWSGASGLITGFGGGGLPTDGSPTLILDFVPSDPVYDYTLATDFLTEQYEVYATDPTAPGYVILKVWE